MDKPNVDWVTAAISFMALIASGLAYAKTKVFAKDDNLAKIKANIDTATAQYETLRLGILALKTKDGEREAENKVTEAICKSAIERILNAYEDGCDSYFLEKVNRKHFDLKYRRSVIDYVENFPELFSSNLTPYNSMLRYYKEFKNMQI